MSKVECYKKQSEFNRAGANVKKTYPRALPVPSNEFIPTMGEGIEVTALQFLQDEKRNKTKTNALEAGNFRALPRGGSRTEEVIELCEAMQDVLAACFSVSGKEIRSQVRCRSEISRIRQIGMYVTHVVVGLTMHEVGLGFQRDRSTVAHACHVIEDMRDDPDSERIILMVEKIAEIAFLRTAR